MEDAYIKVVPLAQGETRDFFWRFDLSPRPWLDPVVVTEVDLKTWFKSIAATLVGSKFRALPKPLAWPPILYRSEPVMARVTFLGAQETKRSGRWQLYFHVEVRTAKRLVLKERFSIIVFS